MAKLDKKAEIRALAEADMEAFIQLVHPKRILGSVHKELIRWMNDPSGTTHKLVLLPRDHQKSVMAGYKAAWEIVRNPSIRILYISSTSNLAVKQLKFIKDILTSPQVKFYWPELIDPEEGRREKWTATEIAVDHPQRRADMIRDPTVWAAGLTTNIVGMHSDLTIMDDIVTMDNATTEEGRDRVRSQYSLLSSIEGAMSRQLVVGTRYHPKDLYDDIMSMKIELFSDDGEPISADDLYDKFERQVENNGEFLWPVQTTSDGKRFGFNWEILARKRAQYQTTGQMMQFRAQYYNDPNDPDGGGIKADSFQYYDRKYLTQSNGYWNMNGLRLNVFAAMDFAFSMNKKADYTAIVVVGVDSNQNFYVLDIERFKAEYPADYFAPLLRLHQKWGFRKVRAEVTAAQVVIVNDLKMNYIRRHGLSLAVEEYRPSRVLGSKEERMTGILNGRYANNQVWHYHGGHCQTLEEELVLTRPPHDDVKDCLASAIDLASLHAPTMARHSPSVDRSAMYNSRFGGIL